MQHLIERQPPPTTTTTDCDYFIPHHLRYEWKQPSGGKEEKVEPYFRAGLECRPWMTGRACPNRYWLWEIRNK